MNAERPKLFLFDLDGTLMSTGGAGSRALAQACHEFLGIGDGIHRISLCGKTDLAIFREIVSTFLMRPPHDGELDNMAACYLKFLKIEMDIASQAQMMPGVEEILGYLQTQKQILLGLGTGNLEKGARLKLARFNLNDYFSFGGYGSDAEDRADVLRAGHRRAEERQNQRILAQDVFIIGDTPLDIAAARRAGFRCVAVATGSYSYNALQQEQPDFLLKDLTEGFALLKKL